jgi:hypothetical protein
MRAVVVSGDLSPAYDTGRESRLSQTPEGRLRVEAEISSGDVAISVTPERVSSATLSAVNSATSSAQLVAANTSRNGLLLFNDDANAAYIKYGTTASSTDYTVKIDSGAYWEMPKPIYTGRIDAIWAADGSGALRVTEL